MAASSDGGRVPYAVFRQKSNFFHDWLSSQLEFKKKKLLTQLHKNRANKSPSLSAEADQQPASCLNWDFLSQNKKRDKNNNKKSTYLSSWHDLKQPVLMLLSFNTKWFFFSKF